MSRVLRFNASNGAGSTNFARRSDALWMTRH